MRECTLEKECKSSSEKIRTLKADEVLELIAGPSQEVVESVTRMKVKTAQDSKVGWITLKDHAGTSSAEKDTTNYTCTATVAVTDTQNIKECKVIRKLAVGEVFVATE